MSHWWSSYILRRPRNFAKSSPYFWLALHRTKVRWRFRKILWFSQNIWTLPCGTLQIRIRFVRQRFDPIVETKLFWCQFVLKTSKSVKGNVQNFGRCQAPMAPVLTQALYIHINYEKIVWTGTLFYPMDFQMTTQMMTILFLLLFNYLFPITV